MKEAVSVGDESGATGFGLATARRSAFDKFFKRRLNDDLVVLDDGWLKKSGLQRQLEFEGYQLRWVTTARLDVNIEDGWQYVTVSRYLWWHRRVRRRNGLTNHYLLKRIKSLR